MEKKKLKKLVLNKDVISKLENVEMNRMKGGQSGLVESVCPACWESQPHVESLCTPCTYGDYGGGGGGTPTGSCAGADTCATCGPVVCDTYGGNTTWQYTQCGNAMTCYF